ncbi:MAG: hypothetical protein AB7P94_13960 [Steroidobacteraceae bacterium]
MPSSPGRKRLQHKLHVIHGACAEDACGSDKFQADRKMRGITAMALRQLVQQSGETGQPDAPAFENMQAQKNLHR